MHKRILQLEMQWILQHFLMYTTHAKERFYLEQGQLEVPHTKGVLITTQMRGAKNHLRP